MKVNRLVLVASACLLAGFAAGWFAHPGWGSSEPPARPPATVKRPERAPDFQGVVERLSAWDAMAGESVRVNGIDLLVRCPLPPPHPNQPPGSRSSERRYRVGIPNGVLVCQAGPVAVGSLVSVWFTGAIGASEPPRVTAEYVATEPWASVPSDDPLQKLRPRD